MTEAQLQIQVADYLRLQYPDVLFHSDFGSGVKLSPHQAAIQKRQNGGRRAWADMFIAKAAARPYITTNPPKFTGKHPNCLNPNAGRLEFYGLFLELKKEGTRLKKKNGDWATPHLQKQAQMLDLLRKQGYCAEFAIGFDEAKRIIDEYLGGK